MTTGLTANLSGPQTALRLDRRQRAQIVHVRHDQGSQAGDQAGRDEHNGQARPVQSAHHCESG